MTTKYDGGSAFPTPYAVGPNDDLYPALPGMTLRDWFAGQELIAMGTWAPPSRNGFIDRAATHSARAAYAYLQADAMIAERSK